MFDFLVMPDGADSYRITAETRDILVWERTGRDNSLGAFVQNQRMTDMYHLAWIASRRLGRFEGSLKQFEETVDIRPEESASAGETSVGADPTPAARRTARSSSSRSQPASRGRGGSRATTRNAA